MQMRQFFIEFILFFYIKCYFLQSNYILHDLWYIFNEFILLFYFFYIKFYFFTVKLHITRFVVYYGLHN